MKVRILFFAVLRDLTGENERQVELNGAATPADVWRSLRNNHPQLSAYVDPPMIAVNQEYVGPDTPLQDGDELAFIPPVSGGA